jgi:Cu2+-exporting ATPase
VDKIAGIFVPVVISISIISFIIWMLAGNENALTHALMAMVTVLVIACPCALGLATPTAIMVGMGKGARNGILIKDADSLERFQKVNVIVVDKTGTLTEGRPSVTDMIWLVNGSLQKEYEEVLTVMEKQSAHPLADAIGASMPDSTNGSIRLDDFENISGKGIRAKVSGKSFLAGNMKFMLEEGLSLSTDDLQKVNNLQEQSKTVVLFANKEKPLAIIGLADTLKVNSREAMNRLQQQGTEVYMLTGDNEQTARSIAHHTGITHYRAGMMPSEKANFIKDLQSGGKIVAMVGDGINDSHALAQADVSIAMGKGSDIAMDVAGITIMSSDLIQLPKAMRLSRLTVHTIHQNLFWAFVYNLIGIPIAAGLLYPIWGFMLNPMIAAAAMALSSVSVVSNSLRLSTVKI